MESPPTIDVLLHRSGVWVEVYLAGGERVDVDLISACAASRRRL